MFLNKHAGKYIPRLIVSCKMCPKIGIYFSSFHVSLQFFDDLTSDLSAFSIQTLTALSLAMTRRLYLFLCVIINRSLPCPSLQSLIIISTKSMDSVTLNISAQQSCSNSDCMEVEEFKCPRAPFTRPYSILNELTSGCSFVSQGIDDCSSERESDYLSVKKSADGKGRQKKSLFDFLQMKQRQKKRKGSM